MGYFLRFYNLPLSVRRDFLLKFLTYDEYLDALDRDRLHIAIRKMSSEDRLPEFRKTFYRYLGTNEQAT